MRELRWHPERFLDYPFNPETAHAEHVLDALNAWGTQASNALFDPQVNFLPNERRLERRLNTVRDPQALTTLRTDRVNILLVVAPPYRGDARNLFIARPVIELIKSKSLPADGDILSPPTIDQPRDHLRPHPGCHHVLRFDGHGSYGDSAGGHSLHQYKGRQGCLILENEKGGADPKSARDLSTLRREHAMPAVVLNACPSGMLDTSAGDAFASVATALLLSGMSSVVAVTDVNGDGRPDILGHSPKIG